MKEVTPFERWMRNQVKKQKNIEDQKILDEMLVELKKKHDAERQQQINDLTEQLEKIGG